MWKVDALPLIRAAMSRDRFKMILRFIRFDNENTRAERVQTDKAAAIRDLWIMLNNNLEKAYKPYECITIDEQLFPFRKFHLNLHNIYLLNQLSMALRFFGPVMHQTRIH